MKPGIYRIYARDEGKQSRYLGRIAVINGHTTVLEDHAHIATTFPDGEIDEKKNKRWEQIANSPHWAIRAEADLEPDAAPKCPVKADEAFMVRDDRLGTEHKLELYGEEAFLDDKHMEPEELEHLMTQVRNREKHLIPC